MSKVIKNGTIVTADRTYKADVLIEGDARAEEVKRKALIHSYRATEAHAERKVSVDSAHY